LSAYAYQEALSLVPAKYARLVANAVMLSNVADMTTTLAAMDGDGHAVTPALVGCLSPYTREHIRRFGQYPTWATCRRRSICNPCRSRSKREDLARILIRPHIRQQPIGTAGVRARGSPSANGVATRSAGARFMG
jgi:hypothetical protein